MVLGWALIDIQSFSALIQRFLRFQRCSELNQPTLILTSLVITDSVMNISEHLWFSAEHYWQAANSQRPWKKPKKVFFLILMLKRREIKNFRITFNGLFWKIRKMWFFPKTVFSFDFMSEDFLTRTKPVTDTKIPPVIEKKTLQELISMFLQCFWSEHVKSLRQQCSWLDQKKSVMFRAESVFFRNDAEKISYFQSWFSIVQNSSESIRRSRITSQVLFPNHILGGGQELRVKNNV